MAAAIFKQEEQVLKDVAVYVSVLPEMKNCNIMSRYSAVLARTSLAQTPGYEVS